MANPLILVVEDAPAIRTLFREGLTARGFRVEVAQDGISGLEAARNLHPDLILLDLRLPGIDGYQFCSELRKTQTVPVIVVTSAFTETADEIRALDLGADDFLRKSVPLDVLAARISSQLRRAGRRVPEAKACECGDPACSIANWRDRNITLGPLAIRSLEGRVVLGDRTVRLGAAAFDLLLFLAAHSGRFFPRPQLRQAAYGIRDDRHLHGSRDIDNLVTRIRRSLGPDAAHLLVTVRGKGYTLRPES